MRPLQVGQIMHFYKVAVCCLLSSVVVQSLSNAAWNASVVASVAVQVIP